MTRIFTLQGSGAAGFPLDLDGALNPSQRAAVTCGEGPKLVIAGAGSGKTRTITYRVAYLMANGVLPAQILLATFTNKAAREMLGRVEALTGGDAASVWGGTFHAIGNRLLRRHAPLVGLQPNYSILDEADSRDLLKVCIGEARIKVEEKRFPAPALIADLISMAFNTQRDLAAVIEERAPHFAPWAEELSRLAGRYEAKKRATNALDYDDLLRFWLALIEDRPDVAERLGRQFRHLLVDEYQDTNVIQGRIVERLSERNGRNLMVVGDDAQCVMQGTRILTPQGYKLVETLRVGDAVLAGAGNGRLIPERIRVIQKSHHPRYLLIRVQGGYQLRASPNHLCFAKVVPQRKWWYVYLMYRRDLGFRIGVSHVSRQGSGSMTAQMRTSPEHADKLWLLEAHQSRQEAQYRETVLGLRYQIPQALFRSDKEMGGKSKMTRAQVAALFEEFGKRGYELLRDRGLLFDYPSFEPKASRSHRRLAINVVMAGAKNGPGRGTEQAHEVVCESYLGQEVIKHFHAVHYRGGYWRLRKMNRDYRVVLNLATQLQQTFARNGHQASVHHKARFVPAREMNGTFRTMPAAGLLPGMKVPVIRNDRVAVGIIESVEWQDNPDSIPFYDLEVERSHNMVSEGIVTHNSIYRFRGANYDNILKFPERNPGTEIFKLEVNYRSTPEILEFTNASILHNASQHRKTLVAHRPRGSLPVVVPVNDAYQEAAFVAQRILQLRDEGAALADMAVLYRAHAHSSILQAELIKRNIPYEVRSGVRFFEQAHIKDAVAYLKVLDNPRDEIAWRRLWLMLPRVGLATAARLWEAVADAPDPRAAALGQALRERLPAAARPHMKRLQDDLRALCALAEDRPPSEIVLAVLETAYPEYLKAAYDSPQARLEDLQQLSVFARAYRTLRGLLSELVLLGELYGQEVRASPSAETERLVLSSIHQAKGLEWKVVFIIRMCEGEFPSDMALREEQGEEEERRIFYVATTRAKDELYLTHPLMDLSPRGNGQILWQPSRFLREIRFTLYEQGEIQAAVWDGQDGGGKDEV
jgi:DNA helicase-2/ATP-dependent DNA helicase PcrA